MINPSSLYSPKGKRQGLQLTVLMKRAGILAFLFLLSVSFSIAGPVAFNPLEPIELVSEKLPFTPKEFYIANVIDEREDPSAIAWLLPTTSNSATPQKVDLKGGGRAGIHAFIQKSLPSNTKLRPVTIRLKEFKVTEAAGEKGGVDGKISLAMDFEFERNGEIVHLTSYSGGARYTRAPGRITLIEPALRQSLTTALNYLNNWMDREAPSNIKLARGVKIFISDFTENAENDTVFYSPDRPLSWQDFQGQPRGNSKYAASVFPSFSYLGDSEIVDGFVHLNLSMKVYMLKGSSWVRSSARDPYSLNHEQRHFDIVKVVVERFKKKILQESFQVDDYDLVIAALYVDAYREMNRMQDQYDGETRHGLDQGIQEKWNRKLDEELNKILKNEN